MKYTDTFKLRNYGNQAYKEPIEVEDTDPDFEANDHN